MTLGEAPERAHDGRADLPDFGPPEPSGPQRRLSGRRRALPTGRAVVGGLLVAMAAVVVFAAAMRGTNQGNTGTYVTASHALQAGSVIEPGDLAMVSLRMPRGVAAEVFASQAPLVGRTLAVGVSGDELLQSSMLVPTGQTPTLRPVTVPLDPASLAGLYTGEPVDVLQTTGTDASTTVSVVLRGAILINVSKPGSDLLSGPTSGSVTIGVATLQEVEAVVVAAHSGSLTVVAATPEDGTGPGAGDSPGPGAASPG